MATSDTKRVAHVSFPQDAAHLTLQLRLHDDRKSFFRLSSEKLDRLRYRLQLLASNVSTGVKKHKKKHKNGGIMPTVPVKFLDVDDQEINAKVTTVGDALMRTKSLQIGAETFIVLHNQPIVTKLQVLEPVMAGITVNPMPKTEFCTADECSWYWYRLDEGNDRKLGVLVSTERRYTPTDDEIGCKFYVECHAPAMKSEFAEDSKAEVITTSVVKGPNRDVFKERRRIGAMCAADKYPDASEVFRVMSYNVLYDGYATTDHAKKNLFSYVDDSVMKETRRIQLIFQEIEENNSDIVCLQEMGEHMFKQFFEPMVNSIGYHGFYSGKTGTTNEGCAAFVRRARFEVEEENTLNLAMTVKNWTNPAAQ
ncbi:2',5'-phosphodiesterase, partial [Phytophthora palmivora]